MTMSNFVLFLAASWLPCLADAALWAVAQHNEGDNCDGAQKGDEEPGFPKILNTCLITYRGTPDQSKWIWTKTTCVNGTVREHGYSDDNCSTSAEDTAFNQEWEVGCKNGRTIKCDAEHEVLIANSYMIPPSGNAAMCVDAYQVSVYAMPLGACYVRMDNSGYVGLKATCENQDVVMHKHTALDCSTGASEFFKVGSTTCAPGFNTNAWLMAKSDANPCATGQGPTPSMTPTQAPPNASVNNTTSNTTSPTPAPSTNNSAPTPGPPPSAYANGASGVNTEQIFLGGIAITLATSWIL